MKKEMVKEKDAGEIFDVTLTYSQNPSAIKKFLDHYFTEDEVKGKVVLDAGSRVGDYGAYLSKKGAKKVVGVDLSKQCTEKAREKFKGDKKLEFHEGDITNLGKFKDNEFDVVICVGTMPYLDKNQSERALGEFLRVTKPEGKILLMFQKEKGIAVKSARFVANKLPAKLYLGLIDKFSFLTKPVIEKMIGRKVNKDYIKYDVLWGLRGVKFGVGVDIPEKYRMDTVTSEQCSEKTTTSYKIIVPFTKTLKA